MGRMNILALLLAGLAFSQQRAEQARKDAVINYRRGKNRPRAHTPNSQVMPAKRAAKTRSNVRKHKNCAMHTRRKYNKQ